MPRARSSVQGGTPLLGTRHACHTVWRCKSKAPATLHRTHCILRKVHVACLHVASYVLHAVRCSMQFRIAVVVFAAGDHLNKVQATFQETQRKFEGRFGLFPDSIALESAQLYGHTIHTAHVRRSAALSAVCRVASHVAQSCIACCALHGVRCMLCRTCFSGARPREQGAGEANGSGRRQAHT